jgi:hypothetical protein
MEKRVPLVITCILFILIAVSVISASVESDFLTLINNERTSVGKGVLVYNPNLNSAAYSHSKEMAENGYFSHDSLDGTSFDKRIVSFGYSGYYALGENIAYSSGNPDANKVFTMWKNSAPHYSNMISGSYNEIGLGVYSKDGLTYYSLDFGKRNGVVIPAPTPVPTPTPNPTPSPSPNPINTNKTTNPASLFGIIDATSKQSRTYRYVSISGYLNEKASVYYEIDNKTRMACSNCNKFSIHFTTKTNNIRVKILAKTSMGKSEEKIIFA